MATKNKKQKTETETETKTETKNMETEVIQMEHNTGITNQSGLSIDAADIDIPRINIVQKTSDIPAPIGSVVIDKQHVIQDAEEVRQVMVISALKGWREDIPYDDDGIPKIAYSREDADRIAAESDYGILEFAEITLLFKQPEGADNEEAYPFPIGNHQYAMGRINVAKDAYRQTYKRLATFAAFNKTTPLQGRLWNFSAGLISKGKYSWYAPSLSVSPEAPDPAVIEFTQSFVA